MKMTRKGFLAGLSAVTVTGWDRLLADGRPFGAGARVPSGRIQRLLARALAHDVRPKAVPVKYDAADLSLPEPIRIGKRLKEYISAQPVTLRADEELVGWLTFDRSVENDLFPRRGHKAFQAVAAKYYLKPQDALATFEWQHSSIDYPKLVSGGLVQLRAEIEASKRKWAGNADRLDYLKGMELALDGLEARVANCARECRRQAEAEQNAARKAKLLEMAERCERVPMGPAKTFLDAVQSIYFCYDCLSDSIGRLDQYLAPFYFVDVKNGTLTRAQAEEALQELFIYIDAHTSHGSGNYDKGGECHMTGGGLTVSGGEPLYRWQFVRELFARAKAAGISTAIETSGYASEGIIRGLMPVTDLWLYDIKGMDAVTHQKHVGVDNAVILRNLRMLDASGAKIILRCPMIPGVNDFPANLKALAELANELKGVSELDVEPYVAYGIEKAHKLGLKVYEAPSAPPAYAREIVAKLSAYTGKARRFLIR